MEQTQSADKREDVVTNWDEFLKHVHVQGAQQPNQSLLFRGQADAAHPLSPSLLRAVWQTRRDKPSQKTMLRREDACREEFASQAHLHLGPALLSNVPTIVHWWTHMQHFGAPTRLLDWTRSPFVAAYFACESNPKGNGAVWSLDVRLDKFFMPGGFSRANDGDLRRIFRAPVPNQKLYMLDKGLRNERMVAQQGVFMLSEDATASHDEILSGLAGRGTNAGRFRKILIPAESKPAFYYRLLAMNINARSLFPGIDGLGRSISEMARFDAFPAVHGKE